MPRIACSRRTAICGLARWTRSLGASWGAAVALCVLLKLFKPRGSAHAVLLSPGTAARRHAWPRCSRFREERIALSLGGRRAELGLARSAFDLCPLMRRAALRWEASIRSGVPAQPSLQASRALSAQASMRRALLARYCRERARAAAVLITRIALHALHRRRPCVLAARWEASVGSGVPTQPSPELTPRRHPPQASQACAGQQRSPRVPRPTWYPSPKAKT